MVHENVKTHKGSVLVTEAGESLQYPLYLPIETLEAKSWRLVGFTLARLWACCCPRPNRSVLWVLQEELLERKSSSVKAEGWQLWLCSPGWGWGCGRGKYLWLWDLIHRKSQTGKHYLLQRRKRCLEILGNPLPDLPTMSSCLAHLLALWRRRGS